MDEGTAPDNLGGGVALNRSGGIVLVGESITTVYRILEIGPLGNSIYPTMVGRAVLAVANFV
jgi:hypothetical protein